MRLHRLVAILLLVEARGQMKAQDLADALETSVRTIYRDIDTLCESGVPLVAVSGPNGGISLMEGYQVAMNHLYEDDVINLYLSGIGIHPEGHSDAGIRLQNTLLKLEKSLPPQYSADIRKARDRFYYDEAPWWGERPPVPCLDTIRRSVWQSKKLQLRYGKTGTDTRLVQPYGMIVKNMEWYLAAFCERSGGLRTFKCDRILEAEMNEESFQIPENFSLEQYWNNSEGSFKKTRAETEKYPVMIKLHIKERDLLDRLEVYDSKKDGDYIMAEVNMHKYEFACCEAMDIAGRAEILAPEELRKFVKDKLSEIFKYYCM